MTLELVDNVADVRLLTPMQQGMLYHSISDPESDVFVNQIAFTIEQDVDPELMRVAWESLSERHEALRTAFFWDGLDDPLAVVRERVDTPWDVVDWSSAEDLDVALRSHMEEERERGFDLSDAPLMRMTLARLGPHRWQWLWTFHHLMIDGWSAQLLLKEFRRSYQPENESETADLPPPFDFVEYASWLARNRQGGEDFWREYLSGFTEPHHLDIPGLGVTEGGGHRTASYVLDRDNVERFIALATANRVTLSDAVCSAWALVLSRWVGTPEVVFGVTTSGRPVNLEGVENAVGLFINTLPLRANVDPDTSVADWLSVMHDNQLRIREFEHAALADVQKWSDLGGGQSLFESLFVFENYPPADADEVLPVSDMRFLERSNYPLAVLAVPEADAFTIKFVYDSNRFSADAIDSLARQLETVIERFGNEPGSRLSEIALCDEEMRAGTSLDPEVAKRLVMDAFDSVVDKSPEALALVTDSGELSYLELQERATALASRLGSMGVAKGDLVGVLHEDPMAMVVGILGALRAGAAYVPLDPTYPRGHTQRVLDVGSIGVVATSPSLAEELPRSVGIAHIDESGPAARSPVPGIEADDLAYVVFTSGSTGDPKGVKVSHGNLAYSTNVRNLVYGGGVGRFLLLSPFAFDSSVAGIFWTLTTGGALVIPRRSTITDVDEVLDLAQRTKVTHLLTLPSVYEIMLERAARGQLDDLEIAIVAGEPSPSSLAEIHRSRHQKAELHNEYGPTEATVWATVHEMTELPGAGAVPIGKPIPGTTVSVRDDHGNSTPIGFAGELWIESPGVSPGYVGDLSSQDRQREPRGIHKTGDLVAWNREGDLLFLGRLDSQVKVRGHRIDLSAVAFELRRQKGVDDAAASISQPDKTKMKHLTGYVTGNVDIEEIKEALLRTLPGFMVPEAILELDEIPRLPNGKLDARQLPDPLITLGEPVSPRTDAERQLVDIWADLLGIDEIGVEKTWNSLGGDSLLGIRMISRARDAGLKIQPADLASSPTIRALAEASERQSTSAETGQLVTIQPTGDRPPLVCLHAAGGNVIPFQVISEYLGSSQPVYAFTAVGIDGREEPLESIPEMADRYLSQLRAVQPSGPYWLLGDCMGGAIALELAHRLESAGDKVEKVIVIDGALPMEGSRATSSLDKAKLAIATGGPLAVVRGAGRLLSRRLGQWSNRVFGGAEGALASYRTKVVEASERAFGTFQPRRIDTTIVLLRSTKRTDVSDGLYWHMSWERFTPDLKVELVESDHETITREPAILEVAELIGQHLGLRSS